MKKLPNLIFNHVLLNRYSQQVAIMSKYWLKYFLYGPLEWLWRSLTYLEIQNFRKK